MNLTIKIVVVSIVSLVAGYSLYPLVHQNSTNQSSVAASKILTNELMTQNTIITTSDVVVTTRMPEVISTPSSKSTLEHAATAKMDSSEAVNIQVFNESLERSSPSPEDAKQQAALTLWSVEHQAKVRGVLEGYLSSKNIDSWFEHIIPNNTLLDEPIVQQSQDVDDDWANETEQIIRDLIQQHEYGFDVEILSLVCKQLTCEFVIRQTAKGSWSEIYISLFKHFITSGIGINGNKGKNIRENIGDEFIFYAQMVFYNPDELLQ